MVISAVFAFAAPAALLIGLRSAKKADMLPFFTGCAFFLLFAMVLEGTLNSLILQSSAGEAIRGNVFLYAAFGGLMAGLFEETGRFAAFKTVLRKKTDNDANALMYGAGHGGAEAAIILGIGSVSNILLSLMINRGDAQALSALLSGVDEAGMSSLISQLSDTPSWMFLAGIAERCFAMILHISLSVIVWFSAKKPGKTGLFVLAVLLHALADGIMSAVAASGASIFVTEGVIALSAAAAAAVSIGIWRRYAGERTTL